MPELPEVHTTVVGLNTVLKNKKIIDIWSDFHIGTAHGQRQTIKNKAYFEQMKKMTIGATITHLDRRGKNILIHLSPSDSSGQVNYTVIVHMKMTGHLMYGKYRKVRKYKVNKLESENKKEKIEVWEAVEEGPLQYSYNQYIHFVCSLSPSNSSGQVTHHLVLSDMRKFASVTFSKTDELHTHETVGALGPEPLESTFTAKHFFEALSSQKNVPIKSALLNQEKMAGIGNIYSDEILWETGIHPLTKAQNIGNQTYTRMYASMKKILTFSIKHGGDSKSDYRNAFGERGGFQDFHKAYGHKNKQCPKKGCRGIIQRIVVRGRSSHFCPIHQKHLI